MSEDIKETQARFDAYERGVATVIDRIETGDLTDPEHIAAALWIVVSKVRDIERGIITGEATRQRIVERWRKAPGAVA